MSEVSGLADEKNDTKSKIIEAAAEIIGRERNLNLTIREIANRAGVNIASVNYYFGSKDNLLSEVEMLLMEKIRQIYTGLDNNSLSTREKLINWADNLIKHLIDYPGIIYLIGTRVLERENTCLNIYLNLLETDLIPLVKELTNIRDENIAGFKVLHLISGIVYPVLIFSSDNETAGIDIGNADTRKKYVRSLVTSIETA
jgi:TetR/AcrR family transcriptional regulator, regulator of cefoperazone and chloramphenicol sensitivity